MSLLFNKITQAGADAATMALFFAKNPTTGTGIASAVSAALSDTAGVLQLTNTASPDTSDGSKYIYPMSIELTVTVAPASATSGTFELSVDNADRYSSGGSALTSVQAGIDRKDGWAARTSVGRVNFGALTLVADADASEIDFASKKIRSVIPVVGDVIRIVFGDGEATTQDIAGTTAKIITIPVAPVRVAPGCSLILRQLFPSNATTPASYEVNVNWYESGHGRN